MLYNDICIERKLSKKIMKVSKLSIGALFLLGSSSLLYSQNDTIKKEQKIEGVVLKSTTNKKTESAVLVEQKKAIIQKQSVSAEEISRKGISNVEQGLTKVTGITAVEGRGLFVRGLEERYNYLLINGLGSPSNNPFQKIIALKQFPTDVVGKLNIYKTFNSNLYGDFAGATFDIETLTIDKSFSKIEFGIGVNTLSTFRNNFKIAENASGISGYLGLNSQDRRLPIEIRNSRPNNYKFNREQSINSFNDSWNVDNVKSLPNTSIGFTTVQKLKTGERGNLGILFSINQSSDYKYREGANNQIVSNGSEVIYSNELKQKEYQYETESSALLGLGYKNKGTNIQLNSIFLQNVSNTIQDNLGYKNFETQNRDLSFFRVNQQDVSRFLDLQLLGSQKINERNILKAGVSYVINKFSQPDRKILEGNKKDENGNILSENQLFINYGGNNLVRQYLDVNSKFYTSGYAEYQLFLGDKGERKEYPIQLTVGYNGFADVRKNSYRFIYGRPNTTDNNLKNVVIDIDQPDETFNNSINNGHLYYEEGSDVSQYLSNIYQFVNAGYANVDLKPNDTWDILIGGRFEKEMSIIRYYQPSANNPDNIVKDKNFILPSLSVKKAIDTKNNIRLSFSKTLTRPVLIELMPINYINPDNTTILGNPNILNSDNYNLDLKWEYFPSNKEMFAANAFAKLINNPIERSILASGNATGVVETFFNAKKAEIVGIELEAIINLNRIAETLSNFTLGTNATFMYSNVERSENQLKTERPIGIDVNQLHKRTLQGAAPYTINADLKYETKNKDNFSTTISLVYNVSGAKIYAVGANGTDNFLEKPFHQLDLVFQRQFNKHWNFKLNIRNLLNAQYRLELGDQSYIPLNVNTNLDYKNHYRGIDFNTTIAYTF